MSSFLADLLKVIQTLTKRTVVIWEKSPGACVATTAPTDREANSVRSMWRSHRHDQQVDHSENFRACPHATAIDTRGIDGTFEVPQAKDVDRRVIVGRGAVSLA